MSSCKECRLWDIDAAKDRAGRVRSNLVALCLWESREVWPLSCNTVTNRRPQPGYMTAKDGHRCPRFIKR